jgi:hypothetical protein
LLNEDIVTSISRTDTMAQPPRPTFQLQDSSSSNPFGDQSQHPYPESHQNPFGSEATLTRDFASHTQYEDEDDFAEKVPLARSGEGLYPPT